MSPAVSLVLSLLSAIIVIDATFYGGMTLIEDDTKLIDQRSKQNEATVFEAVGNTDDDKWKYIGTDIDDIPDNEIYKHLDGAFFQTGTQNNNNIKRWYARMTHNRKYLKEIVDKINKNGQQSAYQYKDLGNYNLYLYTGSTHNYGDQRPEFYIEAQAGNTCYRTALNNLLQIEAFNNKRMKAELARQAKNDKEGAAKGKYKVKKDKSISDGIGNNHDILQNALKWNFNIKMTQIDNQPDMILDFDKVEDEEENADKQIPRVKVPDDRERPVTLYQNKIIGYLVYLVLDIGVGTEGYWSHWVAIKYFHGAGSKSQGWWAWDGSALKGLGKSDGFYKADTFDNVYKNIFNYWHNVRGFKIVNNVLYECKKEEDGKDSNSQSISPSIPYSYNHYNPDQHDDNYKHTDNHGYGAYTKDNNGDYLLFALLTTIFCFAGLAIISSFGICGCIGGCFLDSFLRNHKQRKFDINLQEVEV